MRTNTILNILLLVGMIVLMIFLSYFIINSFKIQIDTAIKDCKESNWNEITISSYSNKPFNCTYFKEVIDNEYAEGLKWVKNHKNLMNN